MRSVLFSSPWRRAPLLLLRRSPAVVLAVAAAGMIVGAAAAAEPLFLSSAGNAALAKQVAERCPADVGMKVAFQNDLAAGGLATLTHFDRAIGDVAAAVTATGPRVLTMSSLTVFDVGRTPDDRGEQGRLLFTTGAFDHVTKLEDSHRPGVWITDTEAGRLHLHAGQSVELSHADRQLAVPIAGVYHDLAVAPPATYWCSTQNLIRQVSIFTEYVPPQLILVDQPTYLALGRQLQAPEVATSWEVPLRSGVTLSRATTVPSQFGRGLERAHIRLPTDRTEGISTDLGFIASRSRAIRGAVRRAISPVAIAGLLVALLLMGAAGSYWVERRSGEIRLLAAKGIGPGPIAVKALLEMTVPALVGSLAGWVLATRIVTLIGPSPLTEAGAVRAGLELAAGSGVISVVLLGLVAAARVRTTTERPIGAAAGWLRWLPVELVMLGGAAWSLSHITTHGAVLGSATQVPRVDLLPLAFPMLFLSGAVAIALRAARLVLGRLRSAGGRWPHALYLTARRLAAGQRIALALLAATALSIGVLVYASALTRSSRASLDAKAQVFVGSDVRVSVDGQPAIPRTLAGRATLVRRPETVTAGGQDVDVIAVDRRTFAQAAFWDRSFGAGSLELVLAKLDHAVPGQEAPAILAHGQLAAPLLTYETNQGQTPLPIRVVSQVGMFPAARALRPLVISAGCSSTSTPDNGRAGCRTPWPGAWGSPAGPICCPWRGNWPPPWSPDSRSVRSFQRSRPASSITGSTRSPACRPGPSCASPWPWWPRPGWPSSRSRPWPPPPPSGPPTAPTWPRCCAPMTERGAPMSERGAPMSERGAPMSERGAPMSEPAAACRDVAKEYVTAGERVVALSAITVTFEPGHITVLAGPSGSGKSTLLRLLSCIDRPTLGAVSVDGVEVSSLNGRRRRALRRRRLGYVFQSPADNLLPYLSASGHLRFAATVRGMTLADGGHDLLERMGLTPQADRRPAQLSGGEQQRLALAAAFVGRPALVVADEPTAQLDVASAGSVFAALTTLRDLGTSFVISSHDEQVIALADKVLYLRHGELVG